MTENRYIPLRCNHLLAHLKLTLALNSIGWQSATFVSSAAESGQAADVQAAVLGRRDRHPARYHERDAPAEQGHPDHPA